MKRENPDDYNDESQKSLPSSDWANPLIAALAPFVYKFGITIPLFYVEAQSLMQLIQENQSFKESFMWIPHLSGPSNSFEMQWMMNHTVTENIPYTFIPVLIIIQMSINAMVRKR